MNQINNFGILSKCDRIGNITICKKNQLEELTNKHCITKLLRGQHAECEYEFSKNEIIEEINDNTIFLDNFSGEIFHRNSTKHLTGTFMIQYNNETLRIKNKLHTNKEVRSLQVMPSVLQTRPIETNVKLDVNYLHDLHLSNRLQLHQLRTNHGISLITDISLVSTILIMSIILVHRYRRRKSRLRLTQPAAISFAASPSIQNLQPVKINL